MNPLLQTLTATAGTLAEAASKLRELGGALGPCDHSVGICVCDLTVLADQCDARAGELARRLPKWAPKAATYRPSV